jgi:hypothetical protein
VILAVFFLPIVVPPLAFRPRLPPTPVHGDISNRRATLSTRATPDESQGCCARASISSGKLWRKRPALRQDTRNRVRERLLARHLGQREHVLQLAPFMTGGWCHRRPATSGSPAAPRNRNAMFTQFRRHKRIHHEPHGSLFGRGSRRTALPRRLQRPQGGLTAPPSALRQLIGGSASGTARRHISSTHGGTGKYEITIQNLDGPSGSSREAQSTIRSSSSEMESKNPFARRMALEPG